MLNNQPQPNPSIANFAPPTTTNTTSQEIPERKPSQKKVSIIVPTNQNLNQNSPKTLTENPPSSELLQSKTQKIPDFTSSNPSPNPLNPTQNPKKPNPASKPPQTGTQPDPKPAQKQEPQLNLDPRSIVKALATCQTFDRNDLEKIEQNFLFYVREKKQFSKISELQPYPGQKTSATNILLNSQTERFLRLPFFSKFSQQQKQMLGLYWRTISQATRNKLPFLSVQGCFELIRQHIEMNGHIYFKPVEEKILNIQLFTKVDLFPIVNGKITIKRDHSDFKRIESQVEIHAYYIFDAWKKIFNEISILRQENEQGYNQLFKKLEKDLEFKTKVIENLLQSFKVMLIHIDDQRFEMSAPYVEFVLKSIWSNYQSDIELFKEKYCISLLNNLNQNFMFFNRNGIPESKTVNEIKKTVQKLVLAFLLESPFKFDTWSKNQQLKTLVKQTNLQALQVFRNLLTKDSRQQNEQATSFAFKEYHWKSFIELVIIVRRQQVQILNPETTKIIFDMVVNFFEENADEFWKDPYDFEHFIDFVKLYKEKCDQSQNIQNQEESLLNLVRVAESLMGPTLQNSPNVQLQQEEDAEYPQNQRFKFFKKVNLEFAKYFTTGQSKDFFDCVCQELMAIIKKSPYNQFQLNDKTQNYQVHRQEIIIKKYFLKVLISIPTKIFEICTIMKSVSPEKLIKFLTFMTISNSESTTEIKELAFKLLDVLLATPETLAEIERILNFNNRKESELDKFAEKLFDTPENWSLLASHCGTLIKKNLFQNQWTESLLHNFNNKSKGLKTNSSCMDYSFVISYSQLLCNIISKLNFDKSQEALELRHYINVLFIRDSVKYFLRFDVQQDKDSYFNSVVTEGVKKKIEALFYVVRLYNTVLMSCLKNKTSLGQQSEGNQLMRASSLKPSKNSIFSAYDLRELGIGDKNFHLQVKPGNQQRETTSYANALTFILVNPKEQKRNILKGINTEYETMVLEAIESLVKLNSKDHLADFFSVNRETGSSLDSRVATWAKVSKSCLPEFVAYIENTLNPVGLEILVFGNLVQDSKRLRRIIDKVRVNLENWSMVMRTKKELLLKQLATLSRYFREQMLKMSLHNREAFAEIEIQDHFDYLIQCIAILIGRYDFGNKRHDYVIIDDILDNFYGGLLTVQTFSMKQFEKWMKNYHRLIFNKINLKYMRRLDSHHDSKGLDPIYTLSEEYFNLLTMFLNCDQYLEQSKCVQILSSQQLTEIVQQFVENIVIYPNFASLPTSLCEILLEVLTMSLRFYFSVCHSKQQRRMFSAEVLNRIQSFNLRPSTNLVLLKLEIFNELEMKFSVEEIDFSNSSLWPLQMNCVDTDVSNINIKNIIESLKQSNLAPASFISICNGLISLIRESTIENQFMSRMIKELLDIYRYFISNSFGISRQQTTKVSRKDTNANAALPYKNVWILELLLAILSNSDDLKAYDTVQHDYENVFLRDETILKRFGLLMRKLSYTEAEICITWLPDLDQSIQQSIVQGEQISFAQKVELNQILKMFNYVLANQYWNNKFADDLTELIEAFVSYREIFKRLAFSNKKPRPQTQQESFLAEIDLIRFSEAKEMTRSVVNQYQKEKIRESSLKSTNSFELMHEVLNIELSAQYSFVCFAIAQNQHLRKFKKNPQLSDASKWNIILIGLLQGLSSRFLELAKNADSLRGILNNFRESVYLPSDNNVELSTEMLFTNSECVSCSLNCSEEMLGDVMFETLGLLMTRIKEICMEMESGAHVEAKERKEELQKVANELKKVDQKARFEWGKIIESEIKAELAQTARENVSKTINLNKKEQALGNSRVSGQSLGNSGMRFGKWERGNDA